MMIRGMNLWTAGDMRRRLKLEMNRETTPEISTGKTLS